MTLHLLRAELRRHWILYPLAALLVFCSRFPPERLLSLAGEPEASLIWSNTLLFAVGVVVVHLIMRGHLWHDDRAFWRTRPITARQLLGSQVMAIGLVVLLPLAAGLLLRILPLHLGFLPSSLAILLPLAIALLGAVVFAACASLAMGRGRVDILPYLAALVAPILSSALLGFLHLFTQPSTSGIRNTGNSVLGGIICILTMTLLGALASLVLATLARRRRAALVTLLVTGVSLPWIGTFSTFDFFRRPPQVVRSIGAVVDPPVEGHRSRPRWTGLAEGEYFAPRSVLASWTDVGKPVTWRWPSQMDFFSGFRLRNDLLASVSMTTPLEQHAQFAAVAEIPALWNDIRSRLPEHATWVTSEASADPHYHDPLDLGQGPAQPGFELHADGVIYRLEAIAPLSPVVPTRLPHPQPGRLEIHRVASGDSQIAILLRHTVPNPSLGGGFEQSRYWTTAPPEFWAVLLHAPSSTAYACIGLQSRANRNGNNGMIIHNRNYLLSFKLPRLETQLLGLDPQKVLAESTLHLFQAVHMGDADADTVQPAH
jgi:hypothetical protein